MNTSFLSDLHSAFFPKQLYYDFRLPRSRRPKIRPILILLKGMNFSSAHWIKGNSALMWRLFQPPQAEDMSAIYCYSYPLLILVSFAHVPHRHFSGEKVREGKEGTVSFPMRKFSESLQSHLKSTVDHFTAPHEAPHFTQRHHNAVRASCLHHFS